MWRINNKLFGWHYVLLKTRVMDFRYIRRVRTDATDRLYIEFGDEIWFLLKNGKTDNGYSWTALTWKREAPEQQ